jgi:hypothetical protein
MAAAIASTLVWFAYTAQTAPERSLRAAPATVLLAQAELREQRANCLRHPAPERRIASCTRIIASSTDTPMTIAHAYLNRGQGRVDSGQDGEALIDFAHAQALLPNFTAATAASRQALYRLYRDCFLAGDAHRRLATCTQIIELPPSVTPFAIEAEAERGLLLAAVGLKAEARAQLQNTLARADKIIHRKGGRGLVARLKATLAALGDGPGSARDATTALQGRSIDR